ncbi:hypothetical protein JR316_0009035 [Psilocybe cubensis]|uniref:Uncharacterized protein n=2 Tax=Psilocybe cubensis TaxID=181762 RepID=A0A8H7XW88_PSICU|nr:hypothetical protein JR316_0009035 [Psilocybe cubensis]KAH9478578.1 hypothetical protein JR316_0009035 [Psilocybe cubensis]
MSKLLSMVSMILLHGLLNRVYACEGDCIVGITNAFLGNYTRPMNIALVNLADSIVSNVIQNKNSPVAPLSYLNPVIAEYNRRAYDYMETAIFKDYFHGKCEDPDTGIDPPGCPKPDCDVVCGTPGSMVHFYSKLRYLAFDANIDLFNDIVAPGSDAYKKVENTVLAAVEASRSGSNKQRRLLRFMRRTDSIVATGSGSLDSRSNDNSKEKRSDQTKSELRSLLNQFRLLLTVACGGGQDGKTNGIPFCTWEDTFKPYILSFP